MKPFTAVLTALLATGPLTCLVLRMRQDRGHSSWIDRFPSSPRMIGPVSIDLGWPEVAAMLAYIAATATFSVQAGRNAATKWYWPLWILLFLSGLALVNFANIGAAFLAIMGLALLARTHDSRKLVVPSSGNP